MLLYNLENQLRIILNTFSTKRSLRIVFDECNLLIFWERYLSERDVHRLECVDVTWDTTLADEGELKFRLIDLS